MKLGRPTFTLVIERSAHARAGHGDDARVTVGSADRAWCAST